MTTRKKTLNFGNKSCRTIRGEKTTLRIINILTQNITICFKESILDLVILGVMGGEGYTK